MKKANYLLVLFISLSFFSCQAEEISTSKQAQLNQAQETIALSLSNDDWAAKMEENPGFILDVRTQGEFEQGYIEGAQLIDVTEALFLENITASDIDRSTPIYLYCRSGSRSKKAMQILKSNGYTKLYELNNGFMGWQSAGLPFVTP